ncbi:hypothetical protein HUU40_16795 [candidate division KSB1 bacterium]|nr:hypothetical protein [candidate division KSB1 bacterium]
MLANPNKAAQNKEQHQQLKNFDAGRISSNNMKDERDGAGSDKDQRHQLPETFNVTQQQQFHADTQCSKEEDQ